MKLLELFGGIGAPRKALENLGIEVKSIDYVEILANAVKAYNSMFDNDYKCQDVRDWNLNIDLLVHGSPCQDFSTAGLNDLSTGRSILYNRTLEIIESELHPRPKYILWENVPNVISKRYKQHFLHYLNKMNELGYRSYYGVISPTQIGVPQYRPRLFTISIRKDIDKKFSFENIIKFPAPELKPITDYLEEHVDEKYVMTQPSMWKALYDGKLSIITRHSWTITTRQIRWNNAGLVVMDNDFYKDKIMVSNGHYSTLKQYLPKDVKFRYLTPKECWRLQGFDDKTFERVKDLKLNDTALWALAGNSICVDVLMEIFKELLK